MAGVVERVFLKGKARAAYVLWLVVLMKCLVPPVWSSPLGVFSWVSGHAVIGAGSAEGVVGASGAEGWGWEEVLAGVWLAGATGMLCGIAGRALWLRRRVLRESAEAPAEVRAWAKGVRVVVCEGALGPAVLGMLRPLVVLPRALVEDSRPEQLRALVGHEVMHVRRRDPWVAGVQLLVAALWWFHPGVWWMNRRIVRVREVCCDLDVMGVLGCEPAAYAQMLVDVLRRGRTLRAMAPSMGVRAVEVTLQRLEQVMGYEQGVRGRRWMRVMAGVVGAMLILPGATMVAARGEAVAATEAAATTTAPVEALVLPDPTPVPGPGKKAVIVAGLKKGAAGNPKWMNRQNFPNVGVKKVAPAVLLPEVVARKKRAG
jgi:beta-lactamase regulating signal transducer with metallopeptidase domain